MNVLTIILFTTLIVALLVFLPWLCFWSINVLFGFSIPFTLKTWFAAVLLITILNGSGAKK